MFICLVQFCRNSLKFIKLKESVILKALGYLRSLSLSPSVYTSAWIAELTARSAQLTRWAADGPPAALWLGGLHQPADQSFSVPPRPGRSTPSPGAWPPRLTLVLGLGQAPEGRGLRDPPLRGG